MKNLQREILGKLGDAVKREVLDKVCKIVTPGIMKVKI